MTTHRNTSEGVQYRSVNKDAWRLFLESAVVKSVKQVRHSSISLQNVAYAKMRSVLKKACRKPVRSVALISSLQAVKGHLYLRWMISFGIINGRSGWITVRNCTKYDQPFYMLPLSKILHPRCRWPLSVKEAYIYMLMGDLGDQEVYCYLKDNIYHILIAGWNPSKEITWWMSILWLCAIETHWGI